MNTWLTQLLEWIERVLPGLLGAMGLGYKIGEIGKEKLRQDLARARLALELKQNEIENAQNFSGKSSDDVINEFILSNRTVGSPPGRKR